MATNYLIRLSAAGFKHCRVEMLDVNSDSTGKEWHGNALTPDLPITNNAIHEVLQAAITSVGAGAVSQNVTVSLAGSVS